MKANQSQKRARKRMLGVVIILGIILVLLSGSFFLLFVVNEFSLVVYPNGEQEVKLEFGENFREPGAQAELVGSVFFREGLSVDAQITVEGSVDSSELGDYPLDYSAKFLRWENDAGRIVRVVDTQPPEITLTTDPNHYTNPGYPYVEEGFLAVDEYDGDLTSSVTWEEKDGEVIYTVTDSSGNQTSVVRDILYRDTIPPEITLSGDLTVEMDMGTQYAEPGYSATDNGDGDITDKVTVSGNLDTSYPGTYVLTYTAVDQAGNEATAQRTVKVVPAGKIIYLTFDDGPTSYTERLLEILGKYDVKATFFVINSEYIDLLPKIVEEGHSVGIHSVTHNYGQIYASDEAFFDDLLTMQDIIYEKTGVKTYLMRFPGGSSNTASNFTPGLMTRLTQSVQEAGFSYFDWNVDSFDAGGAGSSEAVYKNVISGAKRNDISIVLMHDTYAISVNAVERIILWGLENGYTFLPLDQSSPTAHHHVNN